MAVLPTVGGSSGTWGTELNTWLLVAHNEDGTIKDIVQNTQTASYVLVISDSAKIIEMNVAAANTLTIPPNSSVPFPIGTLIGVDQIGAGRTTITPGSGVIIRSAGSLMTLKEQYSSATLRKRNTDEWVLIGDTAV